MLIIENAASRTNDVQGLRAHLTGSVVAKPSCRWSYIGGSQTHQCQRMLALFALHVDSRLAFVQQHPEAVDSSFGQ